MMKKLTASLFVLFILFTNAFAGTYSGGDGSSAETSYQIATKADLLELSNTSGDWESGIFFKQTTDIIFSTADFESGGDYYNGGAGFPRITGTFAATFDGQNKTISNLYINTSQGSTALGLFNILSGTIQNLTVSGMTLICTAGSSRYDGVGMLVGYCNGGTLNNVHISGGSITNTNAATYYGVTGTLAGTIKNATITYCTSSASVTGSQIFTGGLIGSGWGGTNSISYCMASGNVTSTGSRVGGLYGGPNSNGTEVWTSCYATGDVTGTTCGGLVGFIFSNQTFNDCYARGNVTLSSGASVSIGGFYGQEMSPTVAFNRCYSTGSVPAGKGGFGSTTDDGITFSNCFWNTTTSSATNGCYNTTPDGLTGITTGEMQIQTTFTEASWDFSTKWTINASLNNGYPYLIWAEGYDATLPVELSSFIANTTREGEIELNWITESEIENIGFIIERKETNTEDWTEIASYLTESSLQGQGSVTYRTEYRYTDNKVEPNTQYDYRLADVSYSGEKTYHAVTVLGVETNPVPKSFTLHPAYPNPFNPVATINYELITAGNVTLTVYDMAGREIATLVNQYRSVGYHTARWNADTHSSGTYFIQLTQGNNTTVQKIVLLK